MNAITKESASTSTMLVTNDKTFGTGDCGLPFAIASGLDRAMLGDGLSVWTDAAATDTPNSGRTSGRDLQARRAV